MSFRIFFFFCKPKTAYELEYGLVGSEMCINDSPCSCWAKSRNVLVHLRCHIFTSDKHLQNTARCNTCLLYIYDAADYLLCVDLGGRRIIKKQNNTGNNECIAYH